MFDRHASPIEISIVLFIVTPNCKFESRDVLLYVASNRVEIHGCVN